MKTWLVLDCNYLLYRSFFATGHLSYEDVKTGTVYGFLREVRALQELHNTKNIVFCFDHGKSLRQTVYQKYKQNRRADLSPEKEEALDEVRVQTKLLKLKYLPELGYKNVCYAKGFEADDIIASVTQRLPKDQEAIIVTADQDLYQCLTPNVLIYNPHKKKAITLVSFRKEFGLGPVAWVDVKSIAGCPSDNIQGIKGVGEKTALKYLRGQLKNDTAAFKKIVEGDRIWRRNRLLIALPYQGTPSFTLRKDKLNKDAWKSLARELGIRSFDLGG